MYSEIGLLMSYQLVGKQVRPKVFYYTYAPSIHSHTRCSPTGSDRQRSWPLSFSSIWRLLKIFTGGPQSPCQHATALWLVLSTPPTSPSQWYCLYYCIVHCTIDWTQLIYFLATTERLA